MTAGKAHSPSLTLLPIDARHSLSDAVHHSLREAITDGAIEPGTPLREVAIAKMLRVSATPVREALRRLEREGLVETTAHRGATVAAVSPAVLANLYELHETLEAYAMRRVAERAPHHLDPLWRLVEQMDDSITLPEQTIFNRLDVRFHRMVNELSGNAQIAELIEQTHRRIQATRVHLDIHLPDRPRRSQAQHKAMLEAITLGDVTYAETIARLHISAVRDRVMTILEEVPSRNHADSGEMNTG